MIKKIPLATCLVILLVGILCINVKASETLKAGDWIKYEVSITPILEGEVTPVWLKLEFTNIEGTNATMQTTLHLSDGDEWKDTTSINVIHGTESGLIIHPNSEIGDTIHISGYGNVTIKGIAQSTYTGINRLTVYTSFKNSTDSLENFWDKETGMILEQNITKDDLTTFLKVLDTNIWLNQSDNNNIYLNVFYLAILIAVIIILVFFFKTRKNKPRRRIYKRTKQHYK